MVFQEKIINIKNPDKVLEIGPGAFPHPRADICLDKEFDENEAYIQSGYEKPNTKNKPVIYYKSLPFPFKDKEFDYVICSHVIEHIPVNDLEFFISELQRISHKGYIEFPTVFYELINYQPVHIWFMSYRDNKMLFLNKEKFISNNIHKVYREMFYANSDNKYLFNSFDIYKNIYFYGYEWFDKIEYKIVNSFNELVDDNDYKIYKNQCLQINHTNEKIRVDNTLSKLKHYNFSFILKKIIVKIMPQYIIKRLKKFKKKRKKLIDYKVAESAIIETKSLITISTGVIICENVIIRTFENPVTIGQNSQINPFTVIYGGSGVQIGNNVMIAPNCVIAAGNHNYKQTELPMLFGGDISKGPVIIEDDVWIGANCTVTDGVTIKKGAVIGANSVICKDVDEYDIVAGVPAKKIGNRLKFKNKQL